MDLKYSLVNDHCFRLLSIRLIFVGYVFGAPGAPQQVWPQGVPIAFDASVCVEFEYRVLLRFLFGCFLILFASSLLKVYLRLRFE